MKFHFFLSIFYTITNVNPQPETRLRICFFIRLRERAKRVLPSFRMERLSMRRESFHGVADGGEAEVGRVELVGA